MNGTDEAIRILFVDDDRDLAEATARYLELEDERFEVETAGDASEGEERLTEDDFDCVVSDYDMPRRNGVEFLKSVREDHPDLPFILYTGKGSEEVASEAISAGVTDYLQKGGGTGQYTVLANRIGNAVEAYRSARELERRRHRLEQFMKTVPAAVVQIAPNGELLFTNEHTRELFGLDADEHDELSYEDFDWRVTDLEGNAIPRQGLPYQRVLETGEPLYDFRHVVEFPDGRRVILSANGAPLFDAKGDVESTVFAVSDITDLVEREQELEATKERLAAQNRALRRLHEISGDRDLALDEKIRQVLELGCRYLGTEVAFVTSIEPEGNQWEVLHACGTDDRVHPGASVPLSETYCRKTIQQDDGLAIQDAPQEGWTEDAAYRRWNYRTFISQTIWTNGECYGTLCFADRSRRDDPFNEATRTFVDLASHWIGFEFERQRRKERLEEYTDYLDTMLDGIDDVFYAIDPKGNVKRWNDSVRDVTGYTDEELAEMHISDFLTDEDADRAREAIAEVFETGAAHVELTVVSRDGERAPYEFAGARLESPEGEPLLVGVGRDVSERRQHESTLQRERDLFDALFRNLPNPVVYGTLSREDATIRRVNPAFEETFGCEAEEVAGESLHDVIMPEAISADEELNRIVDEMEGESQLRTEVRREAADGPRDFRLDIAIRRREAGPAEGYAIYTDITERKERERRREQRYEAIFNHAFQYTGLLEPDGTVLEVNNAALESLDLESENVVGKPFWETAWWQVGDEEVRDNLRDAIDRAADGEFVRYETEIRGPEDNLILDFSIRPVRDNDGEIVYLLPEGRNITELKALKKRERALERQNERLDEFASVLSHDLRNPLNAAVTHLELARQECDSEELDAVKRSHARMKALIEDVLTLARDGRVVTQEALEVVHLADLFETIGYDMDVGDATLVTETQTAVRADKRRLHRLLENLTRNAVEHGGEEVTVRLGDLPDGFYLEDDGPGVPEDLRDEIFEAGYSTSETGTGFGLSICREIAEAHDWTLRATEGTEGGARFEVTGVDVPP